MRTRDVFAAETSRAGVKLYINGAVRHGCETRWFVRLQEVGYLLRNIEELGGTGTDQRECSSAHRMLT
jgi:hypothetical protein